MREDYDEWKALEKEQEEEMDAIVDKQWSSSLNSFHAETGSHSNVLNLFVICYVVICKYINNIYARLLHYKILFQP